MNNDLINELHNKLDAQDKIINNQALEIARLKDENLEIARLRPLVDLLKEENNGVRKSFNDLQQKIDKAIEWVHHHILKYNCKGITIIDWDELSNPNDLLKILGDKE